MGCIDFDLWIYLASKPQVVSVIRPTTLHFLVSERYKLVDTQMGECLAHIGTIVMPVIIISGCV